MLLYVHWTESDRSWICRDTQVKENTMYAQIAVCRAERYEKLFDDYAPSPELIQPSSNEVTVLGLA